MKFIEIIDVRTRKSTLIPIDSITEIVRQKCGGALIRRIGRRDSIEVDSYIAVLNYLQDMEMVRKTR